MVGELAVAVAVAEVADATWAALERRHELAEEKDVRGAEDALAKEREENLKLRARLEHYQKALEDVEARSVDEQHAEMYARLMKKVESPEFLSKLASASGANKSADRSFNVSDDPSSWLMIADKDLIESELKEEHDELGQDGYVVITQEDIVDGVATFMARCITSLPQTKAMSPQELQKAVSRAFSDLESRGKLRNLWTCGKFMYSAASWGATLVGLYKNPVIIRAATMAVWTSCCVAVRLLL